MRRTPDFVTIFNGYHTVLSRPDDLVGDYLENRRILRALHERLHFSELEDIVNDDEALDAFYVFNGARFIKERVLNLFNDSEYGFPTMLGYLCVVAKRSFNFPFWGETELEDLKLKRDFLLNYSESFEFNYFYKVVCFACVEGVLHSGEQVSLYNYHSDEVSMDKPERLSAAVRDTVNLQGSWTWYKVSEIAYRPGIKNFWNFFKIRRLLKKNTARADEGMRSFSRLSSSDSNVMRYMMKLSACLNLPDDKYAEPGEKILIDDWLELFDKFYPEYEKLKAWYIREQEKENVDDVEVRV